MKSFTETHLRKQSSREVFLLKILYLEQYVGNPTTLEDLKELAVTDQNIETFAALAVDQLIVRSDVNYQIHEDLVESIDNKCTWHEEKRLPFFKTKSGQTFYPRPTEN
jgi:hypothetical protein